jgi:hypothetical protein
VHAFGGTVQYTDDVFPRLYDSTGRFCQIGETRQLDKGGLAIFCKINFGNKE